MMEGISTVYDLYGEYEVRFTTRRRREFEFIKEKCVEVFTRRGTVKRYDLLTCLAPDEMAAFLERELASGIPVDWIEWLAEEVEI